MKLFVRVAAWIGLYLAFVLAPLGVALVADPVAARRPFAVEFAVACGFIAFSLIVLESSLVARLQVASEPFGTDALMQFHRLAALIAVGFLVAHPLLLGLAGGVTASMFDPLTGPAARRGGALAFWSVLLVVVTSIGRRRLHLRYELWKLLHRLMAVVIVAAMLAHIVQIGGYAAAPAVAAILWIHGGLFLALVAWCALARPLLLWRRPWEVAENRDEGADTRTLVLRPVGHAGLAFKPGQFAWLTTGATPFHPQQHPLSFSSSAEPAPDRRIEFTIKALGDWSRTTVPALAPGERVWVDGPFGAFSPDRIADHAADHAANHANAGQELVLIAGGIGISPMRSILRTLRDRGDRLPALLVYAASSQERTVFRHELEELERAHALRLVYVFEAPGPDWRGERGFVTIELLRRHLPENYRRAHFFVCGPSPMLDAMERILSELSVPSEQIHTERFDRV